MSTRATLFVSSLFAIAGSANADIGFAAAASLCRDAAPLGTLLGIEQRERNNVWVYEGELYDAALTTAWAPRFDRETGAFIRLDVDAPNKSDLPTLQTILSRLNEAVLDFAGAIPVANEASGREDIQKIAFDLEAGILAFQVEYFDGVTKIYVDSVTGGVIPHHGADDDIETTVPATAVSTAIALAESTQGAGWVTVGAESESEDIGVLVEVLMLNLKSGMLAEVVVGGDAVLSSTEFEPIGTQATKLAELRAQWNLVVVGLGAAVAEAEVEYPGAGINEVEFEVEIEKTGTTVFWKVGLVTVDLIEVDFFIDATQPIGGGFRFATAPVNVTPGDFNADGAVSAADLAELLSGWGAVNPPMDLDASGAIDAGDLSLLLQNWR